MCHGLQVHYSCFLQSVQGANRRDVAGGNRQRAIEVISCPECIKSQQLDVVPLNNNSLESVTLDIKIGDWEEFALNPPWRFFTITLAFYCLLALPMTLAFCCHIPLPGMFVFSSLPHTTLRHKLWQQNKT